MIKSMTGFGRGECIRDNKKIFIEIKTVNHRYIDYSVKMTKKFSFMEPKIKKIIKNFISRGKVELYVYFEDEGQESNNVKLNKGLLKAYLDNFDSVCEEFNLQKEYSIAFLSRLPEVMSLQEQEFDEDLLFEIMENALTDALENLVIMRENEGQHLKEDLLLKLSALEEARLAIEERAPFVVEEHRVKLQDRLNELMIGKEIDQNRLAQEVAIFADKASIDEELVRLSSHINQMKKTLDLDTSIGRKLDFLAQEMNREANTIASKSNDMVVSNKAIELKSIIEQIREQIQNIE